MTPSGTPRATSLRAIRLLPWVAGAALLAFGTGAQLARPGAVDALSGPVNGDTDHDGLSDELERIMGLNPDRADSDRDEWGDGEELARGSDPKDIEDVPEPVETDVHLAGFSDDGIFHLVASVYTRGGLLAGHDFRLGFVYQGAVYFIPPAAYLPVTELRALRGSTITDAIHVLDIHIPEWVIKELGSISFFATAIPAGAIGPSDADAMNLAVSQGVPYQVSTTPGTVTTSPPVGSRGGAFYTPLVPSGNLPQGTSEGKICVQSTRVVGTGGAGIHMQVEKASCQDGDGTCPTTCASSIGTTISVFDPLTLIGG